MCVAVTRLTWFIEASVIWEGLGKGPCLRCLATDLEILFVSALIGASLLWFPVRQFRERERAILELEKEKLNEERRAQEAKEEEKEREKAEREERRSKIATAIMGESVKLFEAMHEVDMEYTRWQRELRMKRERKMSWKRPKEIWRGNDGRDEKIATSWLEGSIYFGRNSSFRKK